jgi:hypothetical protein
VRVLQHRSTSDRGVRGKPGGSLSRASRPAKSWPSNGLKDKNLFQELNRGDREQQETSAAGDDDENASMHSAVVIYSLADMMRSAKNGFRHPAAEDAHKFRFLALIIFSLRFVSLLLGFQNTRSFCVSAPFVSLRRRHRRVRA